ncbi:glucosaminidase domain-containing protein [Agarilytica rhodophyticola]|uniref:glucosaminidase domain-containing protein n=1 Tax=Agarilytica rhodophyticola TaxID=1737490 RepID=UPI000B343AD9|nr:glucosaminidase domain-containing protein [Agarilytica rhodophyticola]
MKLIIAVAINFYLCAIFVATFFLSQHSSSFSRSPKLEYTLRSKPIALPKFSEIENTSEKKQTFFNYFSLIINDINGQILHQRNELIKIENKLNRGFRLNKKNASTLNAYADFYNVDKQLHWQQKIEQLLLRVNTIPPSLALAQAASESAWGTSRFATKGNNYFGQWCFIKGCGLTPKNRKEGANHEVKYFSSAFESVAAYVKNINTHRAYEKLRKIRAEAVKNNVYPSGILLADGLSNYSERKEHYINEIKTMIKTNDLKDNFDMSQ